MYVKTTQVKPFAVSFIPETFQVRDGIYVWPDWRGADHQIEWKQSTVHAYWYDIKRGQKTACYGVMLINVALDVIRSYDKDPEQLTYDNFLATAASKYQSINAQRVGSFYRYSNDPVTRLARGNYYKEYGVEPEADYDQDKLVQMLEVDLPEFDGLDGWYVLNSKLPVRAIVKK